MTKSVKERVFEAAEQLQATTGKKPKVADVRKAAGCGMQDAADFLQEWRTQQDSRQTAVVAVPDKVNQAFIECWQIASKVANERVEALQHEHELQLASHRETLVEVSAALDQTEDDLTRAQQELAVERDSLSETRIILSQMEHNNLQLSDQLKISNLQVEERTAQLKQSQAQLSEKASTLEQLQIQHGKLEERHALMSERYQEIGNELRTEKQTSFRLQSELEQTKQATAEKTGRINELVQQLQDAHQEIKTEKQANVQLQKDLGQANQTHAEQSGRINELVRQLQDIKTEKAELELLRTAPAYAKGISDALSDYGVEQNPYSPSEYPAEHIQWLKGYTHGLNSKLGLA